ncbi:MAG: class I SAM-dependent methyltransferase [Puniceicoccales bacterium]|jgi:cyclopropane fatty-acyl-phospholipid synthase-like methyltransferase|nr:class I SAM-dependent methyltransferase [Puniceicoccales bacterium]
MENKKALEFFRAMSHDCKDVKQVKLANSSNNDQTSHDASFIMTYANKETELLDLGSGTGLVINKIFDKVAHITVVEPFSEFTKYITNSKNITIFNQTIMDFNSIDVFDLITIFGTMHYFNEQEAVEIYTKYYPYLKERGKLIVKNQFGVNEDVVVDGYSEEQKNNYFAHYRHIEKERKILEIVGYKSIEVVDIYPPECNRWDNTHFYAIVAEK